MVVTVIEAKAVVAMAVTAGGDDVNGLSVNGCIFPPLRSHSPSALLLFLPPVLLLPFTPFILLILLPFEFWGLVEG